ncbi:tagaturonate reductase [Alkalitalea saponilacus]|uniref:Tagaturonate reductase n=1 Tax=Alkalitalea saponilacus TaxID=889453 RepID=A0A1T5AFT1_9BACT|nr:tagaturonate reductase [Alkalitalea saponilacus]SKB33786.1 tagaturonate reductase [Alkalitalea saponilacus]
MMKLNRQNATEAKTYPTRILQFGEGNFLRAFSDWIVHKMNKSIDFNTGIDVVQPLANGMINMLNDQDGLYHVYLKGIKDGQPIQEYTLIDCLNAGINPYTEYEKYESSVLNPELRFVISNTTEAGISWDDNESLDLKPQNSFPGKVAALLYARYKQFNGDASKGLIFFPCELIDRNGDILKKFVLKHAEKWGLEKEFINWVDVACCFCNTLVDRIVPGFPKDDIKEIQRELGFEDDLVVVGEYFHFWVIEAPEWVKKEFPADKAGLDVKFVKDMTKYREQKVQVLNGCHTGSYAVSFLSGIETVREAFENLETGEFMRDLVYDEVLTVLEGEDVELKSFAKKILERFRNPYIRHQWQSIALNAMSKWETRNLPSLLNYYESHGMLPQKLVFSLAAMIAYFKGEADGQKYPVQDDQWIIDFYKEAWEACDGRPVSIYQLVEKVLKLDKVWKRDLNKVPNLTISVSHYLFLIQQVGMKRAVKAVLNKNNPLMQMS